MADSGKKKVDSKAKAAAAGTPSSARYPKFYAKRVVKKTDLPARYLFSSNFKLWPLCRVIRTKIQTGVKPLGLAESFCYEITNLTGCDLEVIVEYEENAQTTVDVTSIPPHQPGQSTTVCFRVRPSGMPGDSWRVDIVLANVCTYAVEDQWTIEGIC